MPVWSNCLKCGGVLYKCTCPQMGPFLPGDAAWSGYWHGYKEPAPPPPPRTPHDPDRYPHRCPKCGDHCYVGIVVDHEYPTECS